MGRTLAGSLRSKPHYLSTVEVDLAEELTGQSLVRTLASWTGLRLESTVVAARGWSVVQQQLAGARPTVVLAVDPIAAMAVDVWRAEGKLAAPLVGLMLGLRFDPAWARTAVDRLAVADEEQGKAAMELGLSPESLVPSGIPVCGGFSSVSPDEKAHLRGKFDLPPGGSVVLVVTDGLEPDELTGALFQLGLAEGATVMFDVARDDDAADLLRRRAGLYGVQARMFGKVEQAGELWAAADIVVARTQIYIEQRAIALRLPYIHLLPGGELEKKTARVYVDRGIGRVVDHLSTLAAEIELQLAPDALVESRRRMGEISRRVAATDIARLVAQVSSRSRQILQERRTVNVPVQAEPPPEPVKSGPLETIGGAPAEEEPDPAQLVADLEAAEAEANRQVTERQAQVDLWTRRAALAAQRGAEDLKREAEQLVERHMSAMHRALAELARLSERRRGLQQSPRRPGLERDFQRLEVEDALAALKRKMGQD